MRYIGNTPDLAGALKSEAVTRPEWHPIWVSFVVSCYTHPRP